MPLDTYARNLAAQLTGREKWPASSGPAAYAGKHPLELLCDLEFRGQDLVHTPLILVDAAAFKKQVGLDEKQRFFSCVQIGGCKGIEDMLVAYNQAKAMNSKVQPTREQRLALDLQASLERVSSFVEGQPLPIVPAAGGKPFLHAGPKGGDPGTEHVGEALAAFGRAYIANQNIDAAADDLVNAVHSAGTLDPSAARAVNLELTYNRLQPWLIASILYTLALILFGISRLAMRTPLMIAGALATLAGVGVHIAGICMRIAILGRAPVSNTYEALLWMGLVAIAAAGIAQLINRKAWYFAAGLGVALLSVLFANLVPLESQTNSLPAVLRSNYWLIIHVLTITASYGVLAVASILGHIYLVKQVLLAKRGTPTDEGTLSHPLIAQTYRAMQLGLVLLTAGTILGGVWAADSWGRFWGWDPKETWALISIVVYFIILHARYLRWLRDFGMAASGVLSFASIVWTFYGVNYLMAAGLHSYGFGAGGGMWVAIWAIAEILFVGVCWLKHRSMVAAASARADTATAPSGTGSVQHA
ncbi:MAG TPA: cytochrome c biogenesis protein CcsA [Phycisphaerales bacterium]|jgi:cytochrome c-type biogenesis protein CcsB|nr:cytochrome c biogenesis protein CcsA [Phycisphaerales bacterium]